MTRWFLLSGAALIVAFLAGCATGVAGYDLDPERRDFAEAKQSLQEHMKVYRPDGVGPFPVVLQFHGCGGVRRVQEQYAVQARDAGVMAVVVDSLTPRGIDYDTAVERVCSGRTLRGGERAGDVVAAIDLVSSIPDADPNQIALAGWSHGGWTVMDTLTFDMERNAPPGLMNAPGPDVFDGVKGAFLIYPFCGFPARTGRNGWAHTDIPADVLIITQDSVAKREDCMKAIDRARESGATVTYDEWDENLTHAFDEDDGSPDSNYRYDAGATARSHVRYVEWLKATFFADADTSAT